MTTGWRIVVSFILVFLFGGVIGGVVGIRFEANRPPPPAPPQPEQFNQQLLGRWFASTQQGLAQDQRVKIRLVIEDAAEDLRRLKRDDAYSATLILEHMQDQVSSILTAPQRARFGEWVQAQRERFHQLQMQQKRTLAPAGN